MTQAASLPFCAISHLLGAGQTVAIVGASGSGKSTLLGILAGLDTPTAGHVLLAGQDLFALDEDQRAALRARHVGFVFQSFQLMPNLTALENVMLPLELAGVPQAKSQATAMLQRVGLGQRLQHRPKVLSGGEQQRVALARAFVVQPELLLADEPSRYWCGLRVLPCQNLPQRWQGGCATTGCGPLYLRASRASSHGSTPGTPT